MARRTSLPPGEECALRTLPVLPGGVSSSVSGPERHATGVSDHCGKMVLQVDAAFGPSVLLVLADADSSMERRKRASALARNW